MLKPTKTILAAAMAGSLAVLSGCSSTPEVQDPNAQAIGQIEPAAYENTSVGYTLTYPKSWGTQVQPEDTLEWNGKPLPAENVVVFNYQPQQANAQPEPLLVLAVYSRDQLEKLVTEVGGDFVQPIVLGTKEDKVLTAYQRGANPYPPASTDGQQFAARLLSPEQLQSAISW
ncbi:hypothetical protein [Halotalea alkalilenta]|uniref:hypothetical protein n=1 Tax=Halotalea alkalilenta TaxID=376489 RepID=UPI0004813001|nr:hypothetical protein [Halotalea alkalilenta]